jgi:hypothetical protein
MLMRAPMAAESARCGHCGYCRHPYAVIADPCVIAAIANTPLRLLRLLRAHIATVAVRCGYSSNCVRLLQTPHCCYCGSLWLLRTPIAAIADRCGWVHIATIADRCCYCVHPVAAVADTPLRLLLLLRTPHCENAAIAVIADTPLRILRTPLRLLQAPHCGYCGPSNAAIAVIADPH